MSATKKLLDHVAGELGVRDPNSPAVLKEAQRRMGKGAPVLKDVIDHLQKAYQGLMVEATIQAHFGNIDWADAIDHTATAIRSLGFEPKER